MYLLTHSKEKHELWNKAKLVGQMPPLKFKEVWAIRFRLEIANQFRELLSLIQTLLVLIDQWAPV